MRQITATKTHACHRLALIYSIIPFIFNTTLRLCKNSDNYVNMQALNIFYFTHRKQMVPEFRSDTIVKFGYSAASLSRTYIEENHTEQDQSQVDGL